MEQYLHRGDAISSPKSAAVGVKVPQPDQHRQKPLPLFLAAILLETVRDFAPFEPVKLQQRTRC